MPKIGLLAGTSDHYSLQLYTRPLLRPLLPQAPDRKWTKIDCSVDRHLAGKVPSAACIKNSHCVGLVGSTGVHFFGTMWVGILHSKVFLFCFWPRLCFGLGWRELWCGGIFEFCLCWHCYDSSLDFGFAKVGFVAICFVDDCL